VSAAPAEPRERRERDRGGERRATALNEFGANAARHGVAATSGSLLQRSVCAILIGDQRD